MSVDIWVYWGGGQVPFSKFFPSLLRNMSQFQFMPASAQNVYTFSISWILQVLIHLFGFKEVILEYWQTLVPFFSFFSSPKNFYLEWYHYQVSVKNVCMTIKRRIHNWDVSVNFQLYFPNTSHSICRTCKDLLILSSHTHTKIGREKFSSHHNLLKKKLW